LSTSPHNLYQASRFRNEKADPLIVEVRQALDLKQHMALYRNEELPMWYTHPLTLLEAGAMSIRDDLPAISGGASTKGAELRVAWMA